MIDLRGDDARLITSIGEDVAARIDDEAPSGIVRFRIIAAAVDGGHICLVFYRTGLEQCYPVLLGAAGQLAITARQSASRFTATRNGSGKRRS